MVKLRYLTETEFNKLVNNKVPFILHDVRESFKRDDEFIVVGIHKMNDIDYYVAVEKRLVNMHSSFLVIETISGKPVVLKHPLSAYFLYKTNTDFSKLNKFKLDIKFINSLDVLDVGLSGLRYPKRGGRRKYMGLRYSKKNDRMRGSGPRYPKKGGGPRLD